MMLVMRFYLVLYLAKIIKTLIKILHKGSGGTIPGFIALSLYPKLLESPKINYSKGVILISGTNGKTTTSKIITHILASGGYKVNHNKTGGNIINGVASTVLADMSLLGRPTSA